MLVALGEPDVLEVQATKLHEEELCAREVHAVYQVRWERFAPKRVPVEQDLVQGSGFADGDQVLVDGAAAATTFIDPNTLQTVLPAGSPGPIAVAVRTSDGQSCRPEVLLNRTP
jgi:hypothetical protein